jgi:hypothetical protein
MNPGLKRLPARFYRSEAGREPVREWLKGLDLADRKVIGEDVKDVEFSWPIGMPLVRSLGHELWEFEAVFRAGGSRASFFAWSRGLWSCSTAS